MERDIEYESHNVGYDQQYPEEEGGGIKCKNYEICETILPQWWFECKNNYLCTNCHMMFGTWGEHTGKGVLPISDNLFCPICLENKRGISQPNCDHTLCISCFKRCYCGDCENEPVFPYSDDVEDAYYADPENQKWDSEYPLIKQYNEEMNKWENDCEDKNENEDYLRKCPLCRK